MNFLNRNKIWETNTDSHNLCKWIKFPSFVPVDDTAALAKAITDLLDNPERRLDLARKGRLRAEELFDLEKNVARLKGLYASHSQIPVSHCPV